MLNNTITSQVVNNNVVVVTSENTINVTQPITNVIEVATPGPQGPAGIVDTGSLLITASAALNVITFEKGDGSIFNITVDTGSGGINTSSFATTGSNIFIGNQIITGSVDITGSLNASNITSSLYGTASWAENSNQSISSSYTLTASYANTASYVQNAISSSYASTASYVENAQTASNILGGKATHVPYFITDTSLATSSIYQSGSTSVIINQDNNTTANPEALYVWQPHPTSINVVSGKGNLDNYLQLNIQNTNQGTDASSDIVATANNGSETDNYIDMGINSQNFAGFLGGPNDAYLYTHGHNFWFGNINDNPYSIFFFNSSSLNPLITLTPDQRVLLNVDTEVAGTLTATNGITGSLLGTASYADKALTASYAENVPLTASYALEALHASNADTATYASTAGNGGVTQLIAGSGIILVPAGGTGAVTVASTGVGGVTIISGSNVTQSFNNVSTWTFNHNLGIRTPIIEIFDSNYNQIIPLNIQLTDTASATITFPTAESGFAIASIGGTSATALSASYALQATYADTASFYAETDPVFVAKSASLATTGSNIFKGNQTITGSLTITGSNTLIGTKTITGSVFITGSKTIIGNNTVTGSMLTTGSIILVGNQTITGSILMSGSSFISGVDYIDFDTTASNVGAVGRLKWNDTDGTLDLGLKGGNVTLQIGQEEVVRVVNKTGINLTEAGYQVVRLNGAQGNRIKVALAKGDGDANSLDTLGLVTENIAVNQEGFITSYGLVRNIDTRGVLQGETWADGDGLYLSPTTFGGITNIPPTAPSHSVRLGYVVQSSPNGSIFVKVDNGYELDELHNVYINTSSLAYGDLLMRDGNNVWINSKNLSGSYTLTGSLTISGSSTFTNIGPSIFSGSVSISGSTAQTGTNTLIGNTTLSGSINISGSTTLNGTTNFYGNHTLSGSNTIVGNTTLSGSFEVSGSSNFHNSVFIVTGSTYIKGITSISGSTDITGSFNVVDGNINIVSGSGFYRWGNRLFNYGQFANTASITVSSGVSASFNLPLTYINDGVSVVNNSRITFTNTGIYNIQYSALANQGNSSPNLRIWFKKTGSNIDNSSTLTVLPNNTQTAITSQFLYPVSASEYIELWYHSSGANTSFPYTAAGSGFPATPSIIVTVTQIA